MQSNLLVYSSGGDLGYATAGTTKRGPGAASVQLPPEAAAYSGQLIEAVARGDRHAFETLYERYAPAVFLALKMLHDYESAEEAVQEVFWRVWRRAGSFDHRRPFAPWLFGIAHNYCIDQLRYRRVRPQLVYEASECSMLSGSADEADIGAAALQSEQRRIVVEALQQLPTEQRQVLELAYFGDLSQQEIATQLDSPLGTVKTRMRLGHRKLRTILQGQFQASF